MSIIKGKKKEILHDIKFQNWMHKLNNKTICMVCSTLRVKTSSNNIRITHQTSIIKVKPAPDLPTVEKPRRLSCKSKKVHKASTIFVLRHFSIKQLSANIPIQAIVNCSKVLGWALVSMGALSNTCIITLWPAWNQCIHLLTENIHFYQHELNDK